jgi:hypothetical protein
MLSKKLKDFFGRRTVLIDHFLALQPNFRQVGNIALALSATPRHPTSTEWNQRLFGMTLFPPAAYI